MRRRLGLFLLMALSACAPVAENNLPSRTVVAETTLPPMKSFAARAPQASRSANNHLVEDFQQLFFEMESGRQLSMFTRFEGPITLRTTGRAAPTMNADLRALLIRLKGEAGIDISRTTAEDANITIESVSRRAIQRVLPQAACFVVPNVSSLAEYRGARRSPKTNWANLTKRDQLAIILPNDASPQEVRDCLHEEIAQALGPLNDLYRLPNSVFNDDNVHTVLTRFDMLILRATYAPELTSGMSRAEVAERLPAIFARINPGGRAPGPRRDTVTPKAYVRAVQTALGPGTSYPNRLAAANEAVQIAAARGWTGPRRGFAYYARGRVLQNVDPRLAREEFQSADQFYARSNQTQLHRAYVSTQLAAFTLSEGKTAETLRLVTPHFDRVRDAQNAALLATLQLLASEALNAQGRVAQAEALRLDSLGWARYGFGADWAVETRVNEISALNTREPPV